MRYIVLIVMLVFFLGLTAVAQSKKEQISALQFQADSLNNVLTAARGQLEQSQQQFKETDERAKRLDEQLVLSKKDLQLTRDSLRASSNENVAMKNKLELNKREN
jgi:septal ring factor EnvC (AmiA/AmiB activator)